MLVFTENKPTVMLSRDDVLKSLGHQIIKGFNAARLADDPETWADIEIERKDCSAELWADITVGEDEIVSLDFHDDAGRFICGFNMTWARDCIFSSTPAWSCHSDRAIAFALNDSIKLNNTN